MAFFVSFSRGSDAGVAVATAVAPSPFPVVVSFISKSFRRQFK
jgi:hypothetical protein